MRSTSHKVSGSEKSISNTPRCRSMCQSGVFGTSHGVFWDNITLLSIFCSGVFVGTPWNWIFNMVSHGFSTLIGDD